MVEQKEGRMGLKKKKKKKKNEMFGNLNVSLTGSKFFTSSN